MSDNPDPRCRGLLYGRSQSHPLSPRQQALMTQMLPRVAVFASPPHPFLLPAQVGLARLARQEMAISDKPEIAGEKESLDASSAHHVPSPQRGEGQGEGVPHTLSLQTLFPPHIKDYAIEIGFGGGEHLAAQAQANPTRGFIGCEPFVNGMAQMLLKIEELGLTNIRLHHGDARAVLEGLPDASLSAAFVLFPDPWPKKRHWKRRFVGPETTAMLGRVLKPGATYRVASDIPDYIRWSLIHIVPSGDFEWCATQPSDWRMRPADWPGTRYEAKALKAGRVPAYLQFQRRMPRGASQ